MKKHSVYKWLRRVAMFSGIPIFGLLFSCCCKYGTNVMYGVPYPDCINGLVMDKATQEGLPNVSVQAADGSISVYTDEVGRFILDKNDCTDLIFSKEDYQSKDTTLCPDLQNVVELQKQSDN